MLTTEPIEWNPQKSFAPYCSPKGVHYYIKIKRTYKPTKQDDYVWSIHREEGHRLESQGVAQGIEQACRDAEEAMQKLINPKRKNKEEERCAQ